MSSAPTSATAGSNIWLSRVRRSTAAIDEIDLLMDTGSFASGSQVIIYGI